MSNESDFKARLLATFIEEAGEHLDKISSHLLALENSADPQGREASLEEVFRAAHSLKGAARAVNHRGIESLCHAAEDVFTQIRNGDLTVSAGLITAMRDVCGGVASMVELGPDFPLPNLQILINTLHEIGSGQGSFRTEQPPLPKPEESKTKGNKVPREAPGSVRIPLAAIDSIVHRAEELVFVKNNLIEHTAQLRTFAAEAEQQFGREFAASFQKILRRMESRQFSDLERIDLVIDELNKILLIPCSTLFDLIPGMIRDITRGKKEPIELQISGGETRLDKRILDELRNPLLHLLRNAVDHGIESSSDRLRAGKSAAGIISVSVKPLGPGEIELSVCDDGRGIDGEEVKKAAIRVGIMTAEAVKKLSEQEILELVFHSPVSTASQITEISGRGLGLAIAREAVESLGGKLSLFTNPGKGAEFRLRLPVSRSTFRGVLILSLDRHYFFPVADVEEVRRIKSEDIRKIRHQLSLVVNGAHLPLMDLGKLLGTREAPEIKDFDQRIAVLISRHGERAAVAVDDIVGEQEVLARPLGPRLKKVRNISGATIALNGRLVPILNSADLLQSLKGLPITGSSPEPAAEPQKLSRKVLVVEDSITSRMLLKNILETAGYEVKTAVDGLDALTLLKTEDFRLVISDVDMPRMNGFILTERIRTDEKLKKLPVVLITALDSREDRERGISAGANEFIVKSGFDQTGLLSCLERIV